MFRRRSRGPAPSLEANEEDLGRWPAVHLRGSTGVSVTGKLQLSSVRLTFPPNRLSRSAGRAGWECSLTDAVHIGVVPRGVMPWPKMMQRHFGIVHDGDLHLFEAGNADKIVAAIHATLAAAER